MHDLALEQGKLEAVHGDMETLRSAVKTRDLYLLLKSPIISADKKIAVIKAIFEDKFDVLTFAYLKLLVDKGREMYLPEITAEFNHQYKVHKGITSVRVISAAPLSDAVAKSLREQIIASGATTSKLDIDFQVDPDLIGGFILEFDNKRYDASVAQKLEDLKSQFSKNLYIKDF